MKSHILIRCITAGLLAWSGAEAASAAEDWPTKPVTLVVPYNAGIAPDIVGRLIAQELSEKLSGRFIVENRVGAGGNVGAQAVARAKPDGYTLLLSTPFPMGLNKLMQANLQFDPDKDFTPVITIAKSPHILVVSPQSNIKTLEDLISLAKARPGHMMAGIPGTGTTSHIAIEALLAARGAAMTMVPYRGSPPPTDILGEQIHVGVGLVPSYVGMVNAGQLLALAVTSDKRSEQLPQVPTAAESGFPGFEATAWYVLVAPVGTPDDIIGKLNKVLNAFLVGTEAKRRFYQLDMQAVGGTAAESRSFMAQEMRKWSPVIKAAKIQM